MSEEYLSEVNLNNQEQNYQNKSNKPLIAGLLLIIAGILALLNWCLFLTIDISTIESIVDISRLQEISPNITVEELKGFLTMCATIGCIISVFPILGGVLSLKQKMWGIAIIGSILGIFTLGPMFISTIFSIIALILLVMIRSEFH